MAEGDKNGGGDGGFVTIRAPEVYAAVMKLREDVQRLLDRGAKLDDHETRIRALESRFVGIAVAAVAVILTGLGAVVWKVVGS